MSRCADLMLGSNHIRVRCGDGITRLGRIKGKIKNRVWIREGNILIITPWSFQDEKWDIFTAIQNHRKLVERDNYL